MRLRCIKSLKILALTYAGEVAVELSTNTLQEQNTRIHVTQLLLNPQLPINNFDQGFLLVFCIICGFRRTSLFCPGHFVASKGDISSTVWPPPSPPHWSKRKSNFPHIIRRKFRMEQLQSHIWQTASLYMVTYLRISSYIIGSPFSYMTWQLLHSEFPDILGKFDFLFYQCISGIGREQHGKRRLNFFLSLKLALPPCAS